ncbi:MAG: nicotinate-nucleotide--dimethylbenzimidazole phosphoribosyltransferase [Deltaproteobacteria bacterium]|nr:nicotinate-nucleotide--dimethylbenzimidazole phosphoribosyltransferase [Deltaproteobacteria bacterium]
MTLLEHTLTSIPPLDHEADRQVQVLLDKKTKPRRSLGKLEDIACQVAAIRGTVHLPVPQKAIVVMAADHGVAEEGISAYPQEVTAQMLLNFARGGAAINVLARHVGAKVVLVDMGVKGDLPKVPEVRSLRVAPGTQNLSRCQAMTREQAVASLERGIQVAGELVDEGISLIAIGDMGIGNTTSSSALVAAFMGVSSSEVTGRGTGLDDAGLFRKIAVVQRALDLHRPDPSRPLDVLACLGGLEIAGLAGVVLGAAARRVPVIMDGFIASTAALVAARLSPRAKDYLIASHRSVEVGHRLVLKSLEKRPYFDLDLRLGEGTGAALTMGLVDAAVKILSEMATFEDAGVSDTGA